MQQFSTLTRVADSAWGTCRAWRTSLVLVLAWALTLNAQAQTTLGTSGVVTSIPPGTYTGQYQVLGDIYLANGTYTITDAYMSFACIVRQKTSTSVLLIGSKLILGPNAVVNVNHSTMAGNASSGTSGLWYGIYFDPHQPGPVLTMQNGCSIKDVAYAITVPASSQSSYYNIIASSISNCLYGLYDNGRHHQSELPAGQYPSKFRFNTIATSGGLSYPLNGTPGQPATQYTTYEAIHLDVDGDAYLNPFAFDVVVDANTIHNAVYGIVATNGVGKYASDGGVMTGIRRTGLWLDQDGQRLSSVAYDISLDGAKNATPQTYTTDKLYGIYATERINFPVGAGAGVRVLGDHGTDLANYKEQTGQYYENCNGDIYSNEAHNLTYGISIGDGNHSSIVNNTIVDCYRGVYVRPNGASSPDYYVGCNSFTNSAAAPSFRAIALEQGAVLNGNNEISYRTTAVINPFATNISPGPAGNKFSGYSVAAPFVNNDNASGVTYIKFDGSADESITSVSGSGGGNVQPPTIPITSSNNCAARGYGATGAMNRGTQQGSGPAAGPTAARIQALMDTVRRQTAPAGRLLAYRAEIRQYHFDQGQQAALATYALTLATANPAAFFDYGLDLLRHYRRTRQSAAGKSWRLALGRHPLAATPELASQLGYFDVVGRLAEARLDPGQTPAPADSAALHRLAEGNHSVAEGAANWLRYYYPQVRIVPAQPHPQPALKVQSVSRRSFSLYPNPATDRLMLQYANTPGQAAELRLVDLITGQTKHLVALPATAEQPVSVTLPHLPAGTYGCQLTIEGVVQATQRVVVQ